MPVILQIRDIELLNDLKNLIHFLSDNFLQYKRPVFLNSHLENMSNLHLVILHQIFQLLFRPQFFLLLPNEIYFEQLRKIQSF